MRLFWMELYKLLRRKAFLAGLFGALEILLLYFCVTNASLYLESLA